MLDMMWCTYSIWRDGFLFRGGRCAASEKSPSLLSAKASCYFRPHERLERGEGPKEGRNGTWSSAYEEGRVKRKGKGSGEPSILLFWVESSIFGQTSFSFRLLLVPL